MPETLLLEHETTSQPEASTFGGQRLKASSFLSRLPIVTRAAKPQIQLESGLEVSAVAPSKESEAERSARILAEWSQVKPGDLQPLDPYTTSPFRGPASEAGAYSLGPEQQQEN